MERVKTVKLFIQIHVSLVIIFEGFCHFLVIRNITVNRNENTCKLQKLSLYAVDIYVTLKRMSNHTFPNINLLKSFQKNPQ